ncbi:GGDEF domain-containing protein [Calothrix sp. NIES-2098]|uniref:GGDEF domain-containing protein n=1 Tax=Calothrix sp. NIES-2098 TaxID=1954171 RepID=UPI000B5EBE3C|nr:GGDEF domain-containing protein [Calothrix sp. NIES-2098]
METPQNDLLTGLPSSRLLPKYFEQLASEQEQFGFLLLDVDGLGYFNYHYGFQEADEKLKQLANLIARVIPEDAEVFRSGGDEFVVFLSKRQMAEVVSIAREVWNQIKQEFSSVPPLERFYLLPDKSFLTIQASFTVSCGIAFYPAHGTDLGALYIAAEKAMWRGGKHLHGGVLTLAEFENNY